MNHPRRLGLLTLVCTACATASTLPPKASAPQAALPQLRVDHQAVVDRLTDQANDLCRVSGQEARVLQVGTTDLSRDPESRHIVYECVESPDTDADEADAAPEPTE